MSALDSLSLRNGLKATSTVLGKQQSGLDAAQKANPQEAAAQMNMNTAQAMLHGKEASLTPPKDAHDQAVRMNQETAEGMLHGQIPIVKKEEPKVVEQQPEQPKQMSYAEMFKMLNPEETPQQKAKRERRERARSIALALGDGLRAISNMHYATQGAKVVHDPNSDMTAANQKRLAMLKAEREKNQSAWLNGYLKAQALDEEARKNKETLAEQVRYHDQLAKNRDRVGDQKDRSLDQKDVSLDQGQQRLDLSKWKYTNDADYKNSILKVKEMLANGQISHWGAQDAMSQMREARLANKANSSSGGNNKTAGYWYEYYDMMDSDEGRKQIEVAKHKMKIRTVTQTNVRYLMDKIKGRKSASAPASSGGGKTAAKGKGRSSSNGNWASGLSLK